MYQYVIDESDCIEFVCPNWLTFAAENAAPQLTEASVLGRSIWTYIANSDCRSVYSMLFSKVREQGCRLVVPFRCDTPTLDRFMELTISLQQTAKLELTGRVLRAEPRPYRAILDPHVQRSDEWVMMCSWCKKALSPEGLWLDIEKAVQELGLFERTVMPNLTHGMCPVCVDTAMQGLGDDDGT